MPKPRFNTNSAKAYLLKYGYTVPDNYNYTNMNNKIRLYDLANERFVHLSLKQVVYRTEEATTRRPEFDSNGIERLMNIDFQPGRVAIDENTRREMFNIINDVQEQPGRVRNEDRFFENNPATLQYINSSIPKNEVEELKLKIKQQLPKTVKAIKQALNNNSTIVFDVPENDTLNETALKQSLLIAIQILKKQLLAKNVNIYLTSRDGKQKRFFLNEHSIGLLNQALFMDNIGNVNDSNTEILSSYYVKNLATITVEISNKKNVNRTNAGFFPFFNKSILNLEKYGIYSNVRNVNINDSCRARTMSNQQSWLMRRQSCLITAIKQSKVFNDEEINRLKAFIRTRTFLIEQLPMICEEFNVQFNLRIVSSNGSVSTRTYGHSEKVIRLIVMFNHYMIDELPNVSSYFINHYEECKNMDTMIYKKNEEYNIGKTSLNIITLINKMIELKLLIPMTKEEIIDIISDFKPDDNIIYNHKRLVNVPNVKHPFIPNYVKPKQTKFFFGYDVDENEFDERMNEIQNVVNSLPLKHHINVRDYYKYSELMNKIMFEYGCYENVFESSGIDNNKLRQSIVYPRPGSDINNGEAFEIKNKTMYYIDMNSSYMSFINGIPTDLTMKERNYKINDLIQTLYRMRKQYKETNPKLATTLKFLMNSCYGYSLRKPKVYKHKYSNNIENYLNNYQNYVFCVYEQKQNEGYVYSCNNFATDYNCLQFGYDILNNYHKFMDKIRNTVKVIYENIDAILIDEEDFNKLKKEGFIGDELGMFKVEHVFDRFVYQSGRKWQGYFNNELVEQRGKW